MLFKKKLSKKFISQIGSVKIGTEAQEISLKTSDECKYFALICFSYK